MSPTTWVFLLMSGWALIATLGYFRELGLKQDAYTDLSQLIHDYRLGPGDLRRTRDHGPIQKRLEREGTIRADDGDGPPIAVGPSSERRQ